MTAPWFPAVMRKPGAMLRVFCFAPAASGASIYRSWRTSHSAPDWLEIWPVQLPGREDRSREPAIRAMPVLLDHLRAALAPIRDELPFALFGLSLGGRIAFELTRQLEADDRGRRPGQLIVASAIEPAMLTAADRASHLLDDPALDLQMARFAGLPEVFRRYPRQLAAVRTLMRNDLALLATGELAGAPQIRTPLLVLGGRQDRAIAPPCLEAWRGRAAGRFALRWLDGGHLFAIDQPEPTLAVIAATLAELT